MPPKGTPGTETPAKDKKKETTNFKTYESQARLLAAVVASLDGVRFDYKKIARYLGKSVTESSVEHRFRPLKVQATLLKGLVDKGIDPGKVDIVQCTKKEEIAAYFGGSTPDGMGFQFRAIKKGADALKGAVSRGESPVDAFKAHLSGSSTAAGSVPVTPSAKRVRSTKTTPGSAATPSTRRSKKIKIEPKSDIEDDDVDSPEVDYSELDKSGSSPEPRRLENANQLLPRSAWDPPPDKTKAQRPRHRAIAPAPPRPAPSSYTLAPILGTTASQPELPNGYTDPATGFGYNVAPRPSLGSTTSSAANSPAMDMTGMRRGSALSSGSYTAGSTPATPTMSFADPTRAPGHTALGMNSMNMGMAGHYVPSAPGTAGMSMTANTSMANMTTYSAAASPPASSSEVQTPQTIASSSTMTPSAMHTEPAGAGNGTSASFISEETQFRSFSASSFAPHNTAATGNANTNGNHNGHNTYSSNQDDISFAAGADFDDFEGENAAGEEEWDAGDV